ncbi:TPA: hypothetical protein HA278_02800 [Candidatus Woesearchaeota archaeon]|nr:hypothetical protein [archaeon]HIJ10962.1 hypothetical protein [Candidatus Woesearchaeota archaeon]
MFTKRGQQGPAAGAAVLLAIIAALLIVFVILLPPQDRAELLGEEVSSSGDDDDVRPINSTVQELLEESPGRIDYLAQDTIEHPLPVINIFTSTESRVLAEKNIALAKRGVFTDETSDFRFTVPDLRHTENVLLNFNVEAIEGEMILLLNGEEIYNAPVRVGNIQPIRLPKNLLSTDNVITFAVSSSGAAFWAVHELEAQHIKVVADVTSVDAQISRNVFLVSETEKKNLEKMVLSFQPECIFETVGRLSVTVNGNVIYDAVPDCALAGVPIEFSPEIVHQGENEIVFRTDKGAYLLSHVSIDSDLKEVDFPTYYFELSVEQFNDVRDEEKRIRMTMEFVDVVVRKRGDIILNGRITPFDTKEVSYQIDISNDIVRGNNAIKIKPRRTLEIRELTVDLIDQ